VPEPLYIAGTGSYAAEIAAWAAQSGRAPAGLIEMLDSTRVGREIHGLPVLGLADRPAGAATLIGIGGDRGETRRALREAGWDRAPALVHPTAHVDPSASLGEGVTVGPLAVVDAATAVGPDSLISRGALVGHHVQVGECVTVGPGANVGGNTTLADCAFLGLGCVVSNGLEVGAMATVAAGAVAIRDVEAGVRVQGVPARLSS